MLRVGQMSPRRLFSSGTSAAPKSGSGRVFKSLAGVGVLGGATYGGLALYADSNSEFKQKWNENAQFTGGQRGIDAVVGLKRSVQSIDAASIQQAQTQATETAQQLQTRAEAAAAEAARVAAATSATVAATASDAAQFVENTKNTVTSTFEATIATVASAQKVVTDTANAAFEQFESIKSSILGPSSTSTPPPPPFPAPKKSVEPAQKVVEAVKKVEETVNKPAASPALATEEAIAEIPIDYTPIETPVAAAAAVVSTPEKPSKKDSKKEKASSKKEREPLPPVLPELEAILSKHASPMNPTLQAQLELLAKNLDAIKPSGKNVSAVENARKVLLDLARTVPVVSDLSSEDMNQALELQAEKFIETLGKQNESALQALSEQEQDFANVFELAMKDQQEALLRAHEEKILEFKAQHESEFATALRTAVEKESEAIQEAWKAKAKELVDNERDGRLARLDHLAIKLKHLEQVAIQSGEFVERMQTVQNIIAALQVVGTKVNEGVPFKKEFSLLKEFAEGDEVLTTVLSAVDENALKDGIVSVDELREEFYDVSQKIRRVQLMPENGGPVSYGVSHVLSYLMLQKHGLVPGNDTEAVLARSKYFLSHGDLESAAREINQLKGWSKVLASDWLRDARLHLEVKQALETVESHIALKNLGVVA
ncbi:Formation of crista junctions protein 1 [Chytriomyces hyalinus]|nr:Formation of crista junctions protein 1 [Chytriomyces hyalinus]